jgi:hypothetical protein
VFAEVIAPETPQAVRDAKAQIQGLADELIAKTAGTRTEVLLEAEPDTQFENIIAVATATLADDSVHYVKGVGWIHRTFLGPQPPNLGPIIFNPDPRPVTAVSRVTRARVPENDIFTAAIVRLPISSEKRVLRLLSAELSHFSKTEQNILVVRIKNGPKSISWWIPFIERWFQPTRNRRSEQLFCTIKLITPVHRRRFDSVGALSKTRMLIYPFLIL